MAGIKQKKWITGLLALSCILSTVMLLVTPGNKADRIRSAAELDSLIQNTLYDHDLRPNQIRSVTVNLDSTNSRKIFRVKVPSRFSKTMFHYDIHNRLSDSEIQTPSKVTLPERDMDIYLYNNNTVIRTIRLSTDPELDSLAFNQTILWQTE